MPRKPASRLCDYSSFGGTGRRYSYPERSRCLDARLMSANSVGYPMQNTSIVKTAGLIVQGQVDMQTVSKTLIGSRTTCGDGVRVGRDVRAFVTIRYCSDSAEVSEEIRLLGAKGLLCSIPPKIDSSIEHILRHENFPVKESEFYKHAFADVAYQRASMEDLRDLKIFGAGVRLFCGGVVAALSFFVDCL